MAKMPFGVLVQWFRRNEAALGCLECRLLTTHGSLNIERFYA